MHLRVYVDDSGSDGTLFSLEGQRIPKDQPTINVSALIVPVSFVEENVLRDWASLRSRMAVDLGLAEPPIFHMRLMYGAGRLRPKAKSDVPNPFFGATESQLRRWVEAANEIIYRKRSMLVTNLSVYISKDKVSEAYAAYYESATFASDYAVLAKAEKDKKALRAFHNVAANPLTEILADFLFMLDKELKRCYRNPRADVIIDQNPSSKGFEVLDALKIIQAEGHLSSIMSINHSSSEASPLLQAADLLAYRVQVKGRELTLGTSNPLFNEWLTRYPLNTPKISDSQKEMELKLVIRYEIARKEASQRSEVFAEKYLVPMSEFRERSRQVIVAAETAGTLGTEGLGVSILKAT